MFRTHHPSPARCHPLGKTLQRQLWPELGLAPDFQLEIEASTSLRNPNPRPHPAAFPAKASQGEHIPLGVSRLPVRFVRVPGSLIDWQLRRINWKATKIPRGQASLQGRCLMPRVAHLFAGPGELSPVQRGNVVRRVNLPSQDSPLIFILEYCFLFII